MYKIVSKLLMYGDMPKDSILMQLSDIFKQMDQDTQSRDELVTRIFTQVKHLLQVATDYGFDKNLWHNYLTYLLITDENPFSLTKSGPTTAVSTSLPKVILRHLRLCLTLIFLKLKNVWALIALQGSHSTRLLVRKN